MNAVLIDDSHNAIEALKVKITTHCPQVSIVGCFVNPIDAIQSGILANADVVFLDVEMPEMDGFEVVKLLGTSNAAIVFVTAYNHYAIKAIRANAFDYLEKPVDTKQLQETIRRLIEKRKNEKLNVSMDNELLNKLLTSVKRLHSQTATITLYLSEGIRIVQLSEIARLESLSNYTKFYLIDGTNIIVSKTMGTYEPELLENNFFRVHRSHIINLQYLRQLHKQGEVWVEMKDGTKIEVSDRRRKELVDKLDGYSG